MKTERGFVLKGNHPYKKEHFSTDSQGAGLAIKSLWKGEASALKRR